MSGEAAQETGCHLLMASPFLQINSRRAITFFPSLPTSGSISLTLYFPRSALSGSGSSPQRGVENGRHAVIEGRCQSNSIKSIRDFWSDVDEILTRTIACLLLRPLTLSSLPQRLHQSHSALTRRTSCDPLPPPVPTRDRRSGDESTSDARRSKSKRHVCPDQDCHFFRPEIALSHSLSSLPSCHFTVFPLRLLPSATPSLLINFLHPNCLAADRGLLRVELINDLMQSVESAATFPPERGHIAAANIPSSHTSDQS